MQRRHFLQAVAAAAAAPALDAGPLRAAETPSAKLRFSAAGKEFHFDTGVLRGTLRTKGQSYGLQPVEDVATGKTLSQWFGLLSPYRMLTAEARFGQAGWDWPSTARLLADGAVEVQWTADKEHPLDMTAVYRLVAAATADVQFTVRPRRDLKQFELFLASYFKGFAKSFAYVRDGKSRFVEATPAAGHWEMFPRDEVAAGLIRDGRWKYPLYPVAWTIRQPMAAPLVLRRDAASGLAAAVMAPAADCFASSTPDGEDVHRSLYLSLLGRDLAAGKPAVARARLVIGRAISDEQAVALYRAFEPGGPG